MPNDSAILELSVTALDFKNTGGTQQIEVITDQEEWIADTGADWISPIKDGNNIKVVVEPNRMVVHAKDVFLYMQGTDMHRSLSSKLLRRLSLNHSIQNFISLRLVVR